METLESIETIDQLLDMHEPEEYEQAGATKEEIRGVISLAIAEEVATDPKEIGYAGKSNAEIAELMNSPYDQQCPPRCSEIMIGIPFAPNMFSEEDIAAALT